MATQIQALPATRPLWRRTLWPLAVIGLLALVYLAAHSSSIPTITFPEAWNLGLRPRIDAAQDWVISNRATHPIFTYFFEPLSRTIDTGMRWAEGVLLATPWLVIVATFGLLGYLLSGPRLALL